MMWEEKTDKLKKVFAHREFHVPFADGRSILKKIEGRFISKQEATYFLSNWANNTKNKQFVQSSASKTLPHFLTGLAANHSYWFVAITGDAPTAKQYVYSCSPKAILSLASLSTHDFFYCGQKIGLVYVFPSRY